MIHIERLTQTYGHTRVLDDVSFDVARSEVVGLLGPNGAGTTTMLRILSGYKPPTAGQASIAGFDVFAEAPAARRCKHLSRTPALTLASADPARPASHPPAG